MTHSPDNQTIFSRRQRLGLGVATLALSGLVFVGGVSSLVERVQRLDMSVAQDRIATTLVEYAGRGLSQLFPSQPDNPIGRRTLTQDVFLKMCQCACE